MRFTENDEIESELYDEFLAIDLTEQKEFEEYNRAKKTIKRRLKDSVSTYVLSSSAVCSALLFQAIDIIQ
jgi:hypothetical protein